MLFRKSYKIVYISPVMSNKILCIEPDINFDHEYFNGLEEFLSDSSDKYSSIQELVETYDEFYHGTASGNEKVNIEDYMESDTEKIPISFLLRLNGYEIITAIDLEQTYKKFEENKDDIAAIVMDIEPNFSYLYGSLIPFMKIEDIPVIALGSGQFEKLAKEKGCTDYVNKNIENDYLTHIDKILEENWIKTNTRAKINFETEETFQEIPNLNIKRTLIPIISLSLALPSLIGIFGGIALNYQKHENIISYDDKVNMHIAESVDFPFSFTRYSCSENGYVEIGKLNVWGFMEGRYYIFKDRKLQNVQKKEGTRSSYEPRVDMYTDGIPSRIEAGANEIYKIEYSRFKSKVPECKIQL